MKYLTILEQYDLNLKEFYNYTQQTNNTSDATILIIFLGLALAIYITFYVPIKLYQINKNTKKIVNELEKLNETKNNKISKDEYIDV